MPILVQILLWKLKLFDIEIVFMSRTLSPPFFKMQIIDVAIQNNGPQSLNFCYLQSSRSIEIYYTY